MCDAPVCQHGAFLILLDYKLCCATQMSETEAEAHWARLLPPELEIDVLLTHGPPHG
jgi:hypothetical protein